MEMCRRAARVDIAQPSPPSGDGWYDTLEQFGRRLSAMEYRLGRWASRSNTLRWLRMAPLMVLIGGLTMACSVPASSPPTLAAPTHQLPPTVTDADVAQRARPSVVRLIARGGDIGSGVRVSTGILTNAHVVAETERVTVQGADGAMYPGSSPDGMPCATSLSSYRKLLPPRWPSRAREPGLGRRCSFSATRWVTGSEMG